MFVLQSKWWNPGDKVELGEAFSSKVCWIPWMQQGFLTPLCFPYSTDFPARVVRARGPAARKEVTIAASKEEACRAVQEIMQVHKSWIHPCHSSSGCSVLWGFVIPARSLELIFGRNFLIQLKISLCLLRFLLCAPGRAGSFCDWISVPASSPTSLPLQIVIFFCLPGLIKSISVLPPYVQMKFHWFSTLALLIYIGFFC